MLFVLVNFHHDLNGKDSYLNRKPFCRTEKQNEKNSAHDTRFIVLPPRLFFAGHHDEHLQVCFRDGPVHASIVSCGAGSVTDKR
jgi:hypothetical protein